MSSLKTIGNRKVSAANCKYEWEIKNFQSYNAKDSSYRSPTLYVSNSTWFVRIYPNGYADEDSAGYVSLYLYRELSRDSTVINFSFGFKTVNGVIVNEKKSTFEDPASGWRLDPALGWPKFMKTSEILKRKSDLLPSGTLTIVCLIELKGTAPDQLSEYSNLAEDLKNLFTSNENTDVTLNVKGKTFSAHRAILAARSSVFAAMFKNEMTEKKTGAVNIFDCDVEAFTIFLLFLYSGEIDFTKCNVCHLYKISDKYDVSKLKLICVDFMIKTLSVENFYEISILGDLFNERELLTKVQCFFNKNFEGIVSSGEWESFLRNNFRLANNLLRAMAPKVKVVE